MNVSKILFATGLAAVLVGVAPPVFAQHHGGGGGQSRGGSANRGGASRGEARAASPRSGPASPGVRTGAPRTYSNVRGGYYSGRVGVYSGRVGAYSGRVGVYPGRVGVPRYSSVAPARFYRPYYSFRPRLSIGFGLWAGYPFAYPYAYYDPFYYPYGYGYGYGSSYYVTPNAYPATTPNGYPPYGYSSNGYPATSYPANPPARQLPQSSTGDQPGQADTGGLSFEITPSTAQLFVDGALVGTVGQFTPTSQPLGLVAGRHQVEVRASGYRTISFDVDILAGQVIPYQGAMER